MPKDLIRTFLVVGTGCSGINLTLASLGRFDFDSLYQYKVCSVNILDDICRSLCNTFG